MEITWNSFGQAEWELLADRAKAPMQQRWTYGAVHQALGGQVHRAVIWDKGLPIALCQLVCRRIFGIADLALASRGPLWLTDCNRPYALSLIRRSLPLPRLRIGLFTLTDPVKSLRLIPLMTPATHAVCDLPVMRENLHGKWRNALRKGERAGLVVQHTRCSATALDEILKRDADQQKQKSYRALPAAFNRAWHHLAPDDLWLFTACEQQRPIARALFLRHGNTASYHIANTTARGRELSAQRLLLWRALGELASDGIKRLDLGSIDTMNAPGLARFKLGAGASACRYGPTVLAI